MSKVFGFDDFAHDTERMMRKGEQAGEVVREYADKMKERAVNIAIGKGLIRTGQGVSGIQTDGKGDRYDVGWITRPNMHLYFHELGFHALDNRKKKHTGRKKLGSRNRGYRGTRATYISPTPHMRPAFDQLKEQFYSDVQKKLE